MGRRMISLPRVTSRDFRIKIRKRHNSRRNVPIKVFTAASNIRRRNATADCDPIDAQCSRPCTSPSISDGQKNSNASSCSSGFKPLLLIGWYNPFHIIRKICRTIYIPKVIWVKPCQSPCSNPCEVMQCNFPNKETTFQVQEQCQQLPKTKYPADRSSNNSSEGKGDVKEVAEAEDDTESLKEKLSKEIGELQREAKALSLPELELRALNLQNALKECKGKKRKGYTKGMLSTILLEVECFRKQFDKIVANHNKCNCDLKSVKRQLQNCRKRNGSTQISTEFAPKRNDEVCIEQQQPLSTITSLPCGCARKEVCGHNPVYINPSCLPCGCHSKAVCTHVTENFCEVPVTCLPCGCRTREVCIHIGNAYGIPISILPCGCHSKDICTHATDSCLPCGCRNRTVCTHNIESVGMPVLLCGCRSRAACTHNTESCLPCGCRSKAVCIHKTENCGVPQNCLPCGCRSRAVCTHISENCAMPSCLPCGCRSKAVCVHATDTGGIPAVLSCGCRSRAVCIHKNEGGGLQITMPCGCRNKATCPHNNNDSCEKSNCNPCGCSSKSTCIHIPSNCIEKLKRLKPAYASNNCSDDDKSITIKSSCGDQGCCGCKCKCKVKLPCEALMDEKGCKTKKPDYKPNISRCYCPCVDKPSPCDSVLSISLIEIIADPVDVESTADFTSDKPFTSNKLFSHAVTSFDSIVLKCNENTEPEDIQVEKSVKCVQIVGCAKGDPASHKLTQGNKPSARQKIKNK